MQKQKHREKKNNQKGIIYGIVHNKDMRNRILFTLLILALYQIGTNIPVPGINLDTLKESLADSSVFQLMTLFGGGSLEQMSIFSLGVGPYITGSIIIQLLAMDVIPALTEMAKSGQKGRQQMEKVTRYLGVVLAFIQGMSITYGFDKQYGILENTGLSGYFFVAMLLTAGSMLLVWLGDRISVNGIGNGLSMIIFAGIVGRLPEQFKTVFETLIPTDSVTTSGILTFVLYVVIYLVIIIGVVVFESAERRIPINRAGTSMAKQSSYLPLKINSASVIPVIFASSVMSAPQIVLSFLNTTWYSKVSSFLNVSSFPGILIYAVLILLFSFFYTDLQIDPATITENLKKSNSYIPGIRSGSETQDYLHKVLYRITVFGAVGLMVLALLPYILPMFTSIPSSSGIGGTGIIIVVGVAMETIEQLTGKANEDQYDIYRQFLNH